MYAVSNMTADPMQKQTVQLPDGTSFLLRTRFVPMQQGWYITELTYNNFTINGMRIVNSPNMLHQFKNQLPFGLACFSDGDREPMLQRDFSSGASVLYVLTADEVANYSEFLSGL